MAAICLHLTALLRFLAVLIIYQLVAVNVKLRDSVQQLFGFEKYEMSYAYSHRRMAIYVHCLQTEVLSVNSFTHTGVKPFKCEICKKALDVFRELAAAHAYSRRRLVVFL